PLSLRGRQARRHHEADLRQSEGRARRLSDSDVVGVCYWTTDGRVTWANDEFLRVTGCDRADLGAGRLDWGRLAPPGATARAAEVWDGLRGGRLPPQE